MSRNDDRQGFLFEPSAEEAPPKRSSSRRVGPVPAEDDARAVAAGLPSEVRFGTSSWSFPGWEGLVYDRKATPTHLARYGLEAYAEHPLLRAVGVDRTYYAPVPPETFAEYAAVVPESFRFLVKAASLCTDPHIRDERGRPTGRNESFLDAVFAAQEVVGPYVEGLGAKAGVLVFQFPPLGGEITREPEKFAESLTAFLADLPVGPIYAVELRDRALFGSDYVAALADGGASHCHSAHPRMPPVDEQRRLVRELPGPFVGRWMLHSGLGYEAARDRYAPFSRIVDEDTETRGSYARAIVESVAESRPVIITANNKAEGSAPETLFRLAALVVGMMRGSDHG